MSHSETEVKGMDKRKIFLPATALLCGLLIALSGAEGLAAVTQSIDWTVIGGGGGQVESDDGVIVLNSTLGQPVVGLTSNGDTDTDLCSGYWHACVEVTSWRYVYLPIVLR